MVAILAEGAEPLCRHCNTMRRVTVTSSEPVVARLPESPAEARRLVSLSRVSAAVHYATLIVAFAIIVYFDRHEWFSADVYEFFNRMLPGHSLDLFVSHNGHWTTIPFLIVLPLFKVFGLRTITPYNIVNAALTVVVTHLLWRWMRRLGVPSWLATSMATIFLFVGAGSEALASWFQLTSALPLALGLVAAMVVDYSGPASARREAAFWILAVAALMCSVTGVAMVFLGTIVALLRRGWLSALRALSIPLGVYVAWLILFGRQNLIQQPGHVSQLALLPQDIWSGGAADIEVTLGLVGTGGVLLVGVVAWLLFRRHLARRSYAFAYAGFATAFFYFLLLGVDRAAAGPGLFTLGRYGYVFVAMLLPCGALALADLYRLASWTATRVVIVATAAFATITGFGHFYSFLQSVNPTYIADRGQILAAAHLVAEGAPLAVDDSAFPEPGNNLDLPLGLLRELLRNGSLPMTASVSDTDILNAALHIQVNVAPQAIEGTASVPTLTASSRSLVTRQGACVSAGAPASTTTVEIIFQAPGSVEIDPGSTGDIDVKLAPSTSPQALSSETNTFAVTGGQADYLNVTASGVAALVTLPPALSTLCGLA